MRAACRRSRNSCAEKFLRVMKPQHFRAGTDIARGGCNVKPRSCVFVVGQPNKNHHSTNRVMKINQAFKVLSAALLLAFTVNTVSAQAPENGDRQRRNRDGGQNGDQQGGRGNFDPAEFQKRMLERTKETLEITDETEWKALEPLITKVGEARMAVGFGGRGGRGGPGGPGGQGGGRGGFGQPNPDAEALQKTIDAKASNAETKAALDKYVAARKAKQAELEKAQAALRKVLTPRQEAIATLNGLL